MKDWRIRLLGKLKIRLWWRNMGMRLMGVMGLGVGWGLVGGVWLICMISSWGKFECKGGKGSDCVFFIFLILIPIDDTI